MLKVGNLPNYYYNILYIINKLIMVDKEVKEKLRIIYEDLSNKISILQSRVSYLESLNNTNPVLKKDSSNSTEKVFKNIENLEELLTIIPDQSFNFANNIVNNNYPTMTLKQFNALDKLAKQVNFNKPLVR